MAVEAEAVTTPAPAVEAEAPATIRRARLVVRRMESPIRYLETRWAFRPKIPGTGLAITESSPRILDPLILLA